MRKRGGRASRNWLRFSGGAKSAVAGRGVPGPEWHWTQRVAATGSGALWPDSVPASGSAPLNRRSPRATKPGDAGPLRADPASPAVSADASAKATESPGLRRAAAVTGC